MVSWLKNRHAEITSAAAIATALAATVGFAATFYQLWKTENALQLSNTYQIQRDARAVAVENYDDIRSFINNDAVDLRDEHAISFWTMFNFYLSVYRQVEAGGVTPTFEESFKTDFCGFVTIPRVNEAWEALLNDRLGEPNVEMREDWCEDR